MDFYKTLNYSLGNEDWSSEAQALQIKKGDRAVCVTASGDRPLHLLMTDCAEVLSIDLNPSQNNLLELKLAAITNLDYEKYMAFLGCYPTEGRYRIFKELKPHLTSAAADFWDARKKMLEKGILYQGRVERLTAHVSKLFHLFRKSKIQKLFSFEDMTAQREFVAKEWDTKYLRKAFEILIHPNLSRLFFKDLGLNVYVEYTKNPGLYIYQRMIDYLNNHLAKKSPLLQLLLLGRVLPDAYFPYLTFDGYTKINSNIDRIKIINENIIDYLIKHSPNQIDCFSMSDIASYMPQPVFEKLLSGIHHAATPNARFCLREFISQRHIPRQFEEIYKRNHVLEDELQRNETNFVYRFIVGEIQK